MSMFPNHWTPPPDPDKPNCPYMPGLKLQITTHNPPPPFGNSLYGFGTRPNVTDEWLKGVTQSEHVLAYPPLTTAYPAKPQAAELTITKAIAIGNARGAQLVACTIIPQDDRKPFAATAKIFDALYYPFSNHLVNAPVDVVDMADRDYSREAAAYEHLHATDHTDFAPRYFGSWTFDLSIGRIGEVQQRPVRLVLIELLDGSSMRELYARNNSGPSAELNAFHYGEEYRFKILARLMDGVVKQVHIGLAQGDFAPRNIMLVPDPRIEHRKDHLPRVVLVDYNNSTLYKRTKFGKHAFQDLVLPRNPMEYYWTESLPEFAGWIPSEWYENPRRRQEWLLRRFGGEEQSNYAPLSEKLEFTPLD